MKWSIANDGKNYRTIIRRRGRNEADSSSPAGKKIITSGNSLVQKVRKDMRIGRQDFIRIAEMSQHAV